MLVLLRRLICLVPLLLAACSVPLSEADFNQTPEARFLRNMVNWLAAHDYAALERQGDAQLDAKSLRPGLERMSASLPKGTPLDVAPVTWQVVQSNTHGRLATVAAEYHYPGNQWLVVTAQLSGEPGAFRILGFRLEPLPMPMAQLHAFKLAGKGPVHYFFLLMTVGAVLITLAALVQCIRTPGLRRKWLWVLFILVGVCAVTLNWTTGAIGVNPLYFNLFSAAFMRLGWSGPWLISFCIPVGALVFLWKHGRKPAEPPEPVVVAD